MDLLLAVGLLVAGLLGADEGIGRPADAVAVAMVAVIALAVAVRSRFPVVVLFVASGGFALLHALGYLQIITAAPVMAALYTVAAAGGRRVAAAGLVVALAGAAAWSPVWSSAGAALRSQAPAGAGIGSVRVIFVLTCAGLFAAAVLAGEVVRSRRTAAAVMAEREARERVTGERLRIARELHDTLGHRMAAIAVQSATALHLLGDARPEVRQALNAVRATSKDAMGEFRATLDLLYEEGEPAGDRAASLDELDELIGAVRDAGVPVEREGTVAGIPAKIDHAAYRIVQEALTNVLRHAGPGVTAVVRLARHGGELLIEVTDDGAGAAAIGEGHGLQGMRSRAEAAGGTFNAGPRPEGGFTVSARLPVGEG